MRTAQAQPALRERADQEAEVLVLALADQQLIADDEGAEHAPILCGLTGPALQILEPADVLPVNEHLRHRAAASDRADDSRAVAVVQAYLAERVAQLLQELF